MKRFLRKPLKDAFFLVARYMRPRLHKKASILMYHAVGSSGAFFNVTPRAFERQVDYLMKKQYNIVSLSELVKRLRQGDDITDCVVLTFNDGYKENLRTVLPVLQKRNIPATFFIVAELLDSNVVTSDGYQFEILGPDEVKEMQNSGLVEFMPTTMHRQPLDDYVFEQAVEAIAYARKDIESIIDRPASIFAYPLGRYTKQLAEYLCNHDWDGAVTTKAGLVRSNTDLCELPRNSIDSATTFTQFKGKVSGAVEVYESWKAT